MRIRLRHRGVYICASHRNAYRYRIGGVEEKNTDATTDFSSISMRFLARLLTIACAFCRGALIEVWWRTSAIAILARTPSAPFFSGGFEDRVGFLDVEFELLFSTTRSGR